MRHLSALLRTNLFSHPGECYCVINYRQNTKRDAIKQHSVKDSRSLVTHRKRYQKLTESANLDVDLGSGPSHQDGGQAKVDMKKTLNEVK